MTARKDEKKKIRELAEKMDCSYSTARRAFLSRKPPAAVTEAVQESAKLQLTESLEAVSQLPGAVSPSIAASQEALATLAKVQFSSLSQAVVTMNRELQKSLQALTQGPALQVAESMKAATRIAESVKAAANDPALRIAESMKAATRIAESVKAMNWEMNRELQKSLQALTQGPALQVAESVKAAANGPALRIAESMTAMNWEMNRELQKSLQALTQGPALQVSKSISAMTRNSVETLTQREAESAAQIAEAMRALSHRSGR